MFDQRKNIICPCGKDLEFLPRNEDRASFSKCLDCIQKGVDGKIVLSYLTPEQTRFNAPVCNLIVLVKRLTVSSVASYSENAPCFIVITSRCTHKNLPIFAFPATQSAEWRDIGRQGRGRTYNWWWSGPDPALDVDPPENGLWFIEERLHFPEDTIIRRPNEAEIVAIVEGREPWESGTSSC